MATCESCCDRTGYADLFQQAPAGYLVTAADGTILDVNDTFLAWTGLARESVQGTNLLALLPTGDRIMYATHALAQLQAHGAYAELALDLVDAGGTRLPAMLSAHRVEPVPGEPAVDRIIVFSAAGRRRYERELEAALRQAQEADNARIRAEETAAAHQQALAAKDNDLRAALQESRRSESMLRTVLNTIDAGIAVVDPEGNAVLKNSYFQYYVDHSHWKEAANDASGDTRVLIFGTDRTTPMPVPDIPNMRAGRGESFSEQLLWIGPPGQQRALSASGRPITELEDFTGSVVTYNDVTRLVNAVAIKEDFVANVSHELRTPLTSIIGYLDLILDDPDLPAHTVAMLEVALRNSERLLQLVADLLSISTAGKILEPQSVDLAQLIRASTTSAAPRAKAGNVVIRTDLPSAVPVEVDPLRIGQVLDNLLSNAIKFSPEGGTVTVSARRTEEHVVVEVSDTGIGMAPEDAREAFTKFFRAGTALKAAIPGAGLGLAITRNIIHAHQGAITLGSEPGMGTTVTVTLPARS